MANVFTADARLIAAQAQITLLTERITRLEAELATIRKERDEALILVTKNTERFATELLRATKAEAALDEVRQACDRQASSDALERRLAALESKGWNGATR